MSATKKITTFATNKTSPDKSITKKKRFDMRPHIKQAKKSIAELNEIAYVALKVAKMNDITLKDGKQISRKDVRNLKQVSYDILDSMLDDYRTSRKRTGETNSALISPFYITGELIRFFFNTDLGPAYIKDETTGEYKIFEKELQDILPNHGDDVCVINQMIINGLFTIYYRTHKLQRVKSNIVGDSDIEKYLGKAMKELDIDPKSFQYFDFSKIRKHFKLPKEKYTKELTEYIEKPEVLSELGRATRYVNDTVSFLKNKESVRIEGEKSQKKAEKEKEREKIREEKRIAKAESDKNKEKRNPIKHAIRTTTTITTSSTPAIIIDMKKGKK